MSNDRQSTKGTLIGNVGTLDIRNASREAIDLIERIGNVGSLLYSRESADALTRITGLIGNLGWTIEATADRFGVDAKTVTKWRDRFLVEGEAGLLDRSSRPKQSPNQTSPEVCARIVHIRTDAHCVGFVNAYRKSPFS